MQKFEYLTVTEPRGEIPELQDLGQKGWELVQAIDVFEDDFDEEAYDEHSGASGSWVEVEMTTWIFKRVIGGIEFTVDYRQFEGF